MAYTPTNNPYIPGDPYSYDLKWIVEQLKRQNSFLTNIDEKIAIAVAAAYAEHGEPIIYNTVADMILADQPINSLAYVLGYNSRGDGGAAFYIITNDYQTVTLSDYYVTISDNKWAVIILIGSYVTPQMFGAFGNGTNDDSGAINTALSIGKTVYIPAGDYLINTPISIENQRIEIHGAGIDKTNIIYNDNSYAITATFTSIAWRAVPFIIENLSIRNNSGGTIKVQNLTQGIIKNVSLRAPDQTDVDNLHIGNESHYFTVDNCYIRGGNGIHIDNSTNGCRIINNYICYCNQAMYIEGGSHLIKHNDVEGYSTIPYYLACINSEIDAHGERNISSASSNMPWIILNGNANKINARLQSDGGSYYNPMMSINGNINDISIKGSSGYELVNSLSGSGNSINLISAAALTNYVLVKGSLVDLSALKSDNANSFLFNSDTDDISQIIPETNFTYNSSTKTITLTSSGTIHFNLSALANGDPVIVYYKYTGITAPGHGNAYCLSTGQGGFEMSVNDNITYIRYPNSTRLYTATLPSGASWKITLRIARYFSDDLIK